MDTFQPFIILCQIVMEKEWYTFFGALAVSLGEGQVIYGGRVSCKMIPVVVFGWRYQKGKWSESKKLGL